MPTQAGETPGFLHGPIIVPTRGPVLAAPLIEALAGPRHELTLSSTRKFAEAP
ncbi:hypothetical protein [Hyphomonas sp. GM-8P]|uniref:hypothetical protein n=1 Tax=Hyphomonas sp. GM-8P TaxID=1280945 RepID=UPI000AA59FF7|nr:hypothetical protein [Hyphomonas sp. GM-8P]RAN41245.1 hypothetical protein HY26_09080 [Hyphomonas sp. GM-8P]